MFIKVIYNFDDDDLFFFIIFWGDSRYMFFYLRVIGFNVLVRYLLEIISE